MGKATCTNLCPYQLTVPKDKKPARCVLRVTSIDAKRRRNNTLTSYKTRLDSIVCLDLTGYIPKGTAKEKIGQWFLDFL